MRMLFFVLLFTACLAGNAWAQNADAERRELAEAVEKQLQRAFDIAGTKVEMRMMWGYSGTYTLLLMSLRDGYKTDDQFNQALGLTEGQSLQVKEIWANATAHLEETMEKIETQIEVVTQFVQDFGTVPEELESEFTAMLETFAPLFEKIDEEIADILTEEQKRQVQELMIAVIPEMPFFDPHIFEALDLTDEQRKQLAEIRKELEPEFEKLFDQMVEEQVRYDEMSDLWHTEINGVVADSTEELEKKREEIRERIREAYQAHEERQLKRGREFSDRVKVRYYDVLTDEQLERLIGLIGNLPEWLMRLRMVEQKEVDEGKESGEQESPAVWTPGPNSWQPGDPLPAGYMQRRQERGRFPRPNTISTQE